MNIDNFKDLRLFRRIGEFLFSYIAGFFMVFIAMIILYIRLYYETHISHKLLLIILIAIEFIWTLYRCYCYFKYDFKFINKNNKPKKLNIVIAIDSEFVFEKFLLKRDFINELKANIDRSKFDIIILPQKYHKNIFLNQNKKLFDKDYVTKINKNILGHYWICGKVDKQKDNGYKCFIETSALVFHKDTDPNLSNEFSKEFGNVYEKNFNFLDERYKSGIVFSGEYSMIVAMYIIGLASMISSDIYTARELHKDLDVSIMEIKEKMVNRTSKDEAIYKNMLNNVKSIQRLELKFISELCYLSQLYIGLPMTGDVSNSSRIKQWGSWIDLREKKSLQFKDPKMMGGVYANRAILCFLLGRNILEARKYMKKSRVGNCSWEYSIIFLDLYAKEYERAKFRIKKVLENKNRNLEFIQYMEITIFINTLLNKEPGHEELLYWEALLCYKQLDFKQSLELVNQYLDWTSGDQKNYEVLPAIQLKKLLLKEF